MSGVIGQEVSRIEGPAKVTGAARYSGEITLPDGVDLAIRGPVSVCHTDNVAMTLRRLLDWALENRLGDLDGLTVTAPSLEDTYLQLTGATPNGDQS